MLHVDLGRGLVTLSTTPDSLLPGIYSFWFDQDAGHARTVRRTVEHMRSAHGETVIRENMIENIKARIRDEANAA